MRQNLSIGFCSSIYVCHVCLSLVLNEGHISSIKLFSILHLCYCSIYQPPLRCCYPVILHFVNLFCLFFFYHFCHLFFIFWSIIFNFENPNQIPFRLPLRCYFISRVNVVERLFITFMPLNMIFFVFLSMKIKQSCNL